MKDRFLNKNPILLCPYRVEIKGVVKDMKLFLSTNLKLLILRDGKMSNLYEYLFNYLYPILLKWIKTS